MAQVEMHAGGGRCGVGAGSARRKRRRISTPPPSLIRWAFFCTCSRAGAPCARGCRFRPETNRQLGTWRAPGPFSMRTRVRTSHRTATTPHTALFLWVLEVSAVAGAQPPPSLCRWCENFEVPCPPLETAPWPFAVVVWCPSPVHTPSRSPERERGGRVGACPCPWPICGFLVFSGPGHRFSQQ